MEKSELKSFWSLWQCHSVDLSNWINFFKVRRLIIEILEILKTVDRNSREPEILRHSGKKKEKKEKWDPAKRSCELVAERLNCLNDSDYANNASFCPRSCNPFVPWIMALKRCYRVINSGKLECPNDTSQERFSLMHFGSNVFCKFKYVR